MNEEEIKITRDDCKALLDKAALSDADMIILDEVLHALSADLVTSEQLEKVLNPEKEVILTGYKAPGWLIEKADYVPDIQKIKHPYDKGVQARIGIEF